MKSIILFNFIFTWLLWSASSCAFDRTYENLPECVAEEIPSVNPRPFTATSIYECKLYGETVFLVNHDECCDQSNFLVDENCNQLCVFGGWSGFPCDSILNALTDKQLIYEKP